MRRGGVAVAAPPRQVPDNELERRCMKNGRSIGVMVLLAFYCACADKSTGPTQGAVATVSVTTTTTTSVFIDGTLALNAAAFDADGKAVAGQAFNWSSSSPLIATVSSTGVVTGVSAGVATITAAVGTIVGQTTISVAPSAAQLLCSSVTPLALNVGEVHPLSGLERSSLCINAGAGTEYVLIAFNSNLDTSTTSSVVSLQASNTTVVGNPPNPLVVGAGPRISPLPVPRNIDFEMQMRATERRELNPRFAAAREWYANRSKPVMASKGFSAIVGVPPTPAIGSIITLNGNANSACGTPQPHGATVVAVSTHAIIAVDTLVPPNGFTTADYQNFAATFDTLIFPLDTLNYGAPTDIDNNGRQLLFFSQLVNQLSPAGATSYVGGFFFSRDLFPLANTNTLAACAGSNVGEMFYLPVVDATQIYNGFFKDKPTVTSQIFTTIVHEFQHLINAGRHLYVNAAATRLEESFLDESQAMLAQELLYYRVSGFTPKSNLNWTTISTGANANGTQQSIVNNYLVQGLGAVNTYLLTDETTTPYNNSENLGTLGSGWVFMRYLLDQSPGTQSTYSRAIDNGVVTGFANLENVFSITPAALATMYQSWAIAQYLDGTGVTTDPIYSNPSWDFRTVLPSALFGSTFPMKTRRLVPGSSVSLALRGGAATYLRFRTIVGSTAQITPINGVVAGTNVTYTLIRTF